MNDPSIEADEGESSNKNESEEEGEVESSKK